MSAPTEAQVRRAVKGALTAGMPVGVVEIAPDGTIRILPDATPNHNINPADLVDMMTP